MEDRIYHGEMTPDDFARELVAAFDRGNMRARKIGTGNQVAVQISTAEAASSGGRTALTVSLISIEDGISVKVGQQALLGVAASLGYTALLALKSPLSFLSRIDDLAQDIENLKLSEEVWKVIDSTAHTYGMSTQLSEKLRRISCGYCATANPVGEARCLACGAPLGDTQPLTCKNCGFVITRKESICSNCRQPI
ncbi:MAG: zinc ribbon domain-containing protein [Anaerolineaceae bacterium]|nr:zinc ribbon domain-containing protein [Anaerolineaceae bacterium]